MSDFDTTLANLGIARTGTGATPTVATTNSSGQLGQSDFLQLMTAQLKNQDPFDPVDNTQMVAQMAQFSSLAGISEMNSTLKAIADRLGATSPNDALAWVGKTVLVEGDTAYPRTGGGISGAIELDTPATDVTVTIEGADGRTLRQVSLGAQPAGTANYEWDGTTDNGDPAGDGPFTVRVQARGADGDIAARSLVWAPVTSVALTGTGAMLTLPGIGQVAATTVRRVG